jgi:hypothetical protein
MKHINPFLLIFFIYFLLTGALKSFISGWSFLFNAPCNDFVVAKSKMKKKYSIKASMIILQNFMQIFLKRL